MKKDRRLPADLEKVRQEIEAVARDCGLDFYDTQFYMLDFNELNEVTANIGFPTRYGHWRFGMEYTRLQRQLGHGFGRLYEIVINNNPGIAYLLDENDIVQQKMVIAHVYGHVDFFKNNYMFQHTNRNMLNVMADHGKLIEGFIDEVGYTPVEQFIDACLSLDNLIDPYAFHCQRASEERKGGEDDCGCNDDCNGGGCKSCKKTKDYSGDEQYKIKTKPYLDSFINTPEFIELQRKREKMEKQKKKNFPPEPELDILKFLMENADKLAGWQKDILSIIREESYYFLPQRQTKIMNEGWAVYWHSHIMSARGMAGAEGHTKYARTHASVISGSKMQINPYRLGFMLFQDIKDRWDRGRHGYEFDNETDYNKRAAWNTNEGKGLEKLFEVRSTKDDLGFIREFMTDDFIREKMLYTYSLDEDDNWYKIASRNPDRIRQKLIDQLTHVGEPIIRVIDGNLHNAKNLLLEHHYTGQELEPYERIKTMENLFKIWQRAVYMVTVLDEQKVIFAFNGKDHYVSTDGKEYKIYSVGGE